MRSGSHDIRVVLRRVGPELRFLLKCLGWALLTGFSTASCCSFGAVAPYGAWRTPCPRRDGSVPVGHAAADAVTSVSREAARGIREIEEYLAAVCGDRLRSDRSDPGELGASGGPA
jgi:hypothetical protein